MNYQLLDKIGQGGMGQVFKALDLGLELEVAVKFMDPALAQDEVSVKRFLEEARKLAKVDHPNIVRVMAAGKWTDGRPYFVMELLRGQPLSDILKRGALAENEVIRISKDVLSALEAAHRNGIIHRDIKSSNIFICEDGRTKVIDFGIARDEAASSVSVFGKPLGTPAYMSPEQALGERATPQSDLYSLGIVMYEMLAGFRPFRAESPVALIRMHVDVQPPQLPIGISPNLTQLVAHALLKDSTARFQTAIEMARQLSAISIPSKVESTHIETNDEQPVSTKSPKAPYYVPRASNSSAASSLPSSNSSISGSSKTGLVFTIVGVGIFGLIVGITIIVWNQNKTHSEVQQSPATAQVTTNPGSDTEPFVDPNGNFVFSSDRSGNADIFYLPSTGGEPINVTNDSGWEGNPSLGKSGRVVFTSMSKTNGDLFSVSLNASQSLQLTKNAYYDGEADQNEAGNIVFVSSRTGNREICTMNADGSSVRVLTHSKAPNGSPSWTSDGRIVFQSFESGNSEIYIMNADGSNRVQLTFEPTYDGQPSCSSDGRIAFASMRLGNSEIFTMNLDGSNLVQMTDAPSKEEMPCWAPGEKIAFVSDRTGNNDIFVMNAKKN